MLFVLNQIIIILLYFSFNFEYFVVQLFNFSDHVFLLFAMISEFFVYFFSFFFVILFIAVEFLHDSLSFISFNLQFLLSHNDVLFEAFHFISEIVNHNL